jgi:hypothetical protein
MIEYYKVLRAIVNAPRYVPSRLLHADLGISTVREGTTDTSRKYKDKIEIEMNWQPQYLTTQKSPEDSKGISQQT